MPADIRIVIPGIMGSVLRAGSGRQVWPPADCATLAKNRFSDADVDALLGEEVVSSDLIRNVWVKSIYNKLLNFLDPQGNKEHPPAGIRPTLYAWHYDWRRDLRDTADRLAAFLDQVLREQGDDIEFTLLAHSMGGLVARTYLEYTKYGGQPARAKVKRLFTFGTPHLGAPKALAHITGRLGMLWLSPAQVQRAVNDPRYPSTYQLLPPDDEPYFWKRRDDHAPLRLDADHVAQLGLNATSLQAMRAWRAGLNLAGLLGSGVRVFAFVSSTHQTVTSLWYKYEGNEITLDPASPPTSGDGTVPMSSACPSRVQHYEVEGEHSTLFGDSEVQLMLPRLLGEATLLATTISGEVHFSLAEPIVPATAPVRGALVLRGQAASVQRLEGSLQIVPDTSWPWPGDLPAPQSLHPFQVEGLRSERFTFELSAPAQPGAYRVILELKYAQKHETLFEPLGVRADA